LPGAGSATFWSQLGQQRTTRILLIRHGRVAWNARSAYTGWTDLPLDEQGEMEAGLLAGRLKAVRLSAVYCSGLVRAARTAEIIAGPRGLAVRLEPDVREINYGEWEGLGEDDIRRAYGDDLFDSWAADPENTRIPGGETFGELRDRAQPAVARIAARHPGETAAVVAHKSVNRVLICCWLGLPVGRYKQIEQENGAINAAVFDGNRVVVETVNDVCHVTEL